MYAPTEVDAYAGSQAFKDDGSAASFDGKPGEFTMTRAAYKRDVLTEDQEKQLQALGIYTAQGLKGQKAAEAKTILGEELYNDLILDLPDDADYGLFRSAAA
ncbi:MAG: hypothetical protein Nk1A_7730 [Endomicrobiia bacterium]|nr:MAG: hypothetical protein Nk1A_7730 [Endomicrobiia bacterium]